MSGELQFGLKVSYDGKSVASGVTANADQVKHFGETAKRAGEQASASLDRTAISAKQTAAALRGVPAQFTDIFTSIAAGQNPMQVMLQQGGQLKDMFGGVGPAARALGGYIAGLVNPYTVAAAAAAGMAFAWHQGNKESDAYTRALILTGNAAGTTAGQMADAAQRVARATGATQGAAAEALALAAGSGSIAAESFDRVAGAAVAMQRATGRAIDDTVEEFDKLAKSPVAASLKLNEQYRYLTAAAYAQIKALDDQGRSSEAAALAIKTYADAIEERSGQIRQNLGTLERTWNAVAGAAKKGWDAMLDIGRKDSLAEKIDAAEKRVKTLQLAMQALGAASKKTDLEAAEKELAALKGKAAAEDAVAKAKGETAKKDQAGIEWAREGDKFLTRRQQMEKEIHRARELGAQAGQTDLEIQKRIAAIREKYTEKKATPDGLDDAAREQAKSYAQQYEAAVKLARGVELEGAAHEKQLPVARALAEARATLSDAQAREVELAMAGALLVEMRTKAEKDAADQAKIYTDALRAQVAPLEERMRLLATERENAGKTEAEINALAIARLQEARAIAAANGAMEQHLDFYDREIAARQALGDELERQKQAQADWLAGAQAASRDYVRSTEDAAGQTKRAWAGTWRRAEDDLTQFFVSGKLNVRGFVEYTLSELARIKLAQPLVKGLASASDGLFDKLFGGGGSSYPAPPPGITEISFGGFAKGAAFNSPDLHRYVNTVVDRPTRFRFAKGGAIGEMGEAGAEGIMPLKRDKQGRLGVIAEGAGGGINLTYAPVFEIDARGAAVGVAPLLHGVVEAAVQRSRAEMMRELGNGGALAVATGRRRS